VSARSRPCPDLTVGPGDSPGPRPGV
jgi:hypothetical protein